MLQVIVLTGAGDDDRDNQSVNTKDTSHDNGDDRLDDECGLEDSHGANTYARLGSTVCSAHVSENESTHDAHTAEEEGLVGITVHCTKECRKGKQLLRDEKIISKQRANYLQRIGLDAFAIASVKVCVKKL